jgi:tetratricopeptide (TPR) repeat protein
MSILSGLALMLLSWPLAHGLVADDLTLTDVMRETEAGYALIDSQPTVAREHFTNAGNLLDELTKKQHGAERSVIFAQRWYEFVATVYIAAARDADARALVRHALTLYPSHAPLHVALGSIIELGILHDWPDLRGTGLEIGRWGTQYALEAAAGDYRRALDLEPRLALVRLHLGWVHLVQRDKRARDDFVQALADAQTPPVRYLAHLFLGAFAEWQRDWAGALQHYESARQVDGTSQTAYVAASHVQEMLGDRDAARALAHAAVTRGVGVQNPWWTYRLGGVDEQLLLWLRDEAQRP